MIYLFTGTDVAKARAKAFAWVRAARDKAPDATYIRLQGKEITEEALRDALGAQGLFFSKALVLVDDPFADEHAKDAVLALLEELAASENPIGILAPKLHPAHGKRVSAAAAKTFTEDARPVRARGFNSALANALAAKDGPALWLELERARRVGDVPEALHGLLHWKARDLMQKGGGAWGKEGARGLSVSLIELLRDSRSGGLSLSESLERFALSLRK